MDIQIHLKNGQVTRFCQENRAKCERIFKPVKPIKLFSRQHIVIQDNRTIRVFACAEVEWVQFITQCDPRWSIPNGPKPMMLLSEEEYETKIAAAELKIEIRKNATSAGSVILDKALLRFSMHSGKQYFGQMTYLPPEYGPEPNGIYGKRNTQEHVLHVIINPQNIIQWKVDCWPAEIRGHVWEASHKLTS